MAEERRQPPKTNPHEFQHDLIIAAEDGDVYHIPHDDWKNERYRVCPKEFADHEGWNAIRDVLQYGANLATVPERSRLPGDRWQYQAFGTCYVVNVDSLRTHHKFSLAQNLKAK